MRQSLPLMHFYSGKLLQFYSGVDRQRLLSPEQYEIVEARTSRGVSRVML